MAKKSTSDTKVTRITASDTAKRMPVTKPAKTKETKSEKAEKLGKAGRRNPLAAMGGYFKGAWQELRQVHWPTRRATWGLTGAVLLFSAFFVLFITLLDAGFKFLFEQILK